MDIIFIISMVFLALTFLTFIQIILQKIDKSKSIYNLRKWAGIFLITYIILFSIWLIKVNV